MSILDELKQLQGLPPPAMPSLWPQTWGWAVLMALVAVLIGVTLILWLRRWQANAYRRAALAELDLIQQRCQLYPNDHEPLRDIPELLKRAALSRLGRDAPGIARMGGQEWQSLLESMTQSPLSGHLTPNLTMLAYAQDRELSSVDKSAVFADCRRWLETHHDPV